MKAARPFRWGILGTGNIASKFAAELPRSRSGRLVASASRSTENAAAFAKTHGGEAITGYDALLAREDIDAIYLSLPNALHCEWTLAALDAGKHVLCEKPMALDSSEAREMFRRSAQRGRLLIEAFMYRAHPQTRLLFDTVASGAIGEIRLVRANFTFRREASREDARYQAGPGGGSLMDVGCYCVDFARTLLGREPDRVECLAHRHEFGVDDFAAGLLGFGSGALATFTCGMTVLSDQTAHIAGTEGRIEIPRFWQAKEGFSLISPKGTVEKLRVREKRPLYAVEADAFAEVVAGAPNWNAPENTLGNLRVLEQLRERAAL
ncbi:MAG: Gfo/Idh/MocA family oxidoreductase [Verrucomicrobiae bacterium]|nr:Gfo/Idh/MocA family oxidoreductase [Verrucomicrobiae bacterium]